MSVLKSRSGRKAQREAMLLALNLEEGPQAEELTCLLEAAEGKEIFFLEPPEGTQPRGCLGFSLVRPMLDC